MNAGVLMMIFIIAIAKILREVDFFVYRGSFRFRFALFTRAQGVPFLHTIGRTSNHSVSWCYRCGGNAAPYTPFYGHTPCMIDYTNIILFAW